MGVWQCDVKLYKIDKEDWAPELSAQRRRRRGSRTDVFCSGIWSEDIRSADACRRPYGSRAYLQLSSI